VTPRVLSWGTQTTNNIHKEIRETEREREKERAGGRERGMEGGGQRKQRQTERG